MKLQSDQQSVQGRKATVPLQLSSMCQKVNKIENLYRIRIWRNWKRGRQGRSRKKKMKMKMMNKRKKKKKTMRKKKKKNINFQMASLTLRSDLRSRC